MSIIVPANSAAGGGLGVANSCRFNSGSSDYLNRTPSSAGNQKKWTWSAWIKRSKLGSEEFVFYSRASADNDTRFYFESDAFKFQNTVSNTTNVRLFTNRVFRDVSAWYNIVISYDSTVSTPDTNSIQMFVNGVKETSFSATIYPSQNQDTFVNDDALHTIGRRSDGASNYFNGYMAEVCLIDGTALDATSFGEFDEDSGIWKPINVSGLTYGTNGFYLDFEDSSALGNDAAGSNNWTANNLTAIDQSTDTCTNNFATMNPLFAGDANITYSEGNLKTTAANESQKNAVSTIAVSSGKWYCEMVSRNGTNYPGFGIMDSQSVLQTSVLYLGSSVDSYCMFQDGNYYTNGSAVSTGTSWGVGSIMGVSIDLDSGTKTIKFYKNGSQTHSATIATPANAYVFAVSHNTNGTIAEINFGSPPYAISSGNTDGNGYGNFEYAVPSGYLSLCTANLSEVLS